MPSYAEHIQQSVVFPTRAFQLQADALHFHQCDLMALIRRYGTPLRLSYLPCIGARIAYAKKWFEDSMRARNYRADYHYCYCTKSSHFAFVLKEVLRNGAHIETSSAFDIPIIARLHAKGHLTHTHYIIGNGYKTPDYVGYLAQLIRDGFTHCIPVLDHADELSQYATYLQDVAQWPVGVRLAAEEEPNFEFYTSRLGIRYTELVPFYQNVLKPSNATLRLLHFFIHTGIKDTPYFWGELNRFVQAYCKLKTLCPTLDILDIGGGLPVTHTLTQNYDYPTLVAHIVDTIYRICKQHQVAPPHLMTEFGTFTVAETGAVLYQILGEKKQNDRERWYMINGSLITQLPDVWALKHRYIVLPINHWNAPYHKVNIGGLTCDSMDYYSAESHVSEVFMPVQKKGQEPLYIGFFQTGAYQESLSGYGGLQHCLIPTPQHIVVAHDANGQAHHTRFRSEQSHQSMLDILGYNA